MKKEILDKESNSYAFNRGYKLYLEGRGINCSYCRPHRGENEEHKAEKSWKLKTKKRKQWIENSKSDDRRSFEFRWGKGHPLEPKFERPWDEWTLKWHQWRDISFGEWKKALTKRLG